MALPSRNHTFPTTPASHHYHPPHHYRKKRGSNGTNGTNGTTGTALPPGPSAGNTAGPLRQLLVHQEEEAGVMGGGSSRDASEEDNDAFSEHSDSAPSVPRGLSQALSSPTQLARGIPTTARDRALVDSKAHRHNYTNAFAGALPLTATTRSSPGPSLSYPGPASSSQAPSQQTQTARNKSSSTTFRDPAVSNTLAQAAAALSSSSSNDLSRYAADNEDKSSGSNRTGRANSIDSSSTDDQIVPRTDKRTTVSPNVLLKLSTLPEPGTGLAAATAEGSTPRPPPFGGSGTTASPLMASSSIMQRQDSSSTEWQADESEVRSTASSQSHHEGQRAPLPIREVVGDDGEVSDGGTASPYDGDVEFAARTPISQQVASMQIGGQQQQQIQQSAGPAKGGPGASFSNIDRSQAEKLNELTVPGQTPPPLNGIASEQGHDGVKDVPCRVYTAAGGPDALASPDESSAVTSVAQVVTEPSTPSSSSMATSSTPAQPSQGPSQQQQQHPSASDIHTDLIRLNAPQVVSRLLSHAAGNSDTSPIASATSPPREVSHSVAVRIYVQTFFDVPTLATCTNLLRTAKLSLGAGLANRVRIVAGVVGRIPSSDLEGEGSKKGGGLDLDQRAGIARSCRWVDEVIQGVPYFPQLDSSPSGGVASTSIDSRPDGSTTVKAAVKGGVAGVGGEGRVADAQEADLDTLLRSLDTIWIARLVRGIEVQQQQQQRHPSNDVSSGEVDGEQWRAQMILLPRS